MRSGEYGLPGSELIYRETLRHGSNVVDVRSCSSAVSVAYSYSKVHPNDFDLRGLLKAGTEHDVNQCAASHFNLCFNSCCIFRSHGSNDSTILDST